MPARPASPPASAPAAAAGPADEVVRLREELIRRERLASVGLLISDIAHEVYNPLAWVKLNTGLLQKLAQEATASGDARVLLERLPKMIELLKDNDEGLNRIQHVVDALRLMSRSHSDAKAEEDVNAICQKTLVMLNYAFHRKNVEVSSELGELPKLWCNGSDVAQAVMNLLVNANDAVPASGHVQLRTYAREGSVVVEVNDDGPGVPPDIRARLFEPFFTTKPLGTGLGLPLVKSVADDHGGRVEVDSNRGGGATFRLVLGGPAGPGPGHTLK